MSFKIKPIFLLTLFAGIFMLNDVANAQKGIFPSLGDSRSGTSGFQFLKINVDARSSAMGSSNIADAADGSSLYFNPALAVMASTSQIYLGHTAYFPEISLNYASYMHKFRNNNMVVGGSLTFLDSGEMDETNEFNPTGTGRVFRVVNLAAGLSYSHRLSDLFSYGITGRYLEESIEEISLRTVVFDVGFFYRVGETGLRFAVGLNNFGLDATPAGETVRQTPQGEITEDEFESVKPPTMFMIGAAFDAYKSSTLDVLVTGQLTNPSDNAERFSVGTELTYIQRFMLRVGYEFGKDEAVLPTAGVGFRLPLGNNVLGIDYGFATRERLGNIHRLALKFNL